MVRATQLVRDGARFESRQHDSKVHILNICTASHNFPLAQSLSHFPFTALPLPCFKGKEQGCPRSELCLVKCSYPPLWTLTYHSLPSPQRKVCVCQPNLTATLYSCTHSDSLCLASLSLLRCRYRVNKSRSRENGELASLAIVSMKST